MAIIKIEVKNQSAIDQKPRVYFTCHPEDFERYFRKICDDIFATHDCCIYYTEDMSEAIPPEDLETDLGRNNLFVVPVTFKLLSTPNRAMEVDIPYALQEHIPVLPVMMEPGLDELYSMPDKFGELQYLNPNSSDTTEISYEEKLKKHLESVLISDALAQRVRAAFDAYIFLSYRKKDRRYANELMRLIHNIPQCRDIAIWFDEFLTPGKSFRESIDNILRDSKLFALLVTPNLLEEPNFVMTDEYPAADRSGIPILPAEMEDTDRETLCKKYPNIPECVKTSDEVFHSRLLETVTRLATEANNTPEHDYLIGLAYLDGIDVEVNRQRALELITSAAERNLPEAMEKLSRMYNEGIGTALDYRKAVEWAERLTEYNKANLGEHHPDTLHSLNNLALLYSAFGDYRKALQLQETVYDLTCQVMGQEHSNTLTALNNLAYTCMIAGNYPKAREALEKAYDIAIKVPGEEDPLTLTVLNNLAYTYGELGDYQKALQLHQTVYTLSCKVLGEEHRDTLSALNNTAIVHSHLREPDKALPLYEKVYTLRCKILGEEHPDTITALNNVASACGALGDHAKALELAKKVYDISVKVLGEEHPNTLLALNSLAYIHGLSGNYRTEMELQQTVYALRCKVLGEEHPHTINTLHNIAYCWGALGDYGKELQLQVKIYNLRCKVLGPEHPHTLISLNNVAYTTGKLGDERKALELYKIVYAVRCKVLGEEAMDSLDALNNMAVSCYELGDYKNALMLFQNLYLLKRKVLGEHHPDTDSALNSLYIVKQKLEQD